MTINKNIKKTFCIHPTSLLLAFVLFSLVASSPSFSDGSLDRLDAQIARKIILGCERFAQAKSKNIAIAVVDQGAHLIAFSRMNNVPSGIAEVAQWKASSAALYGASTKDFQDMAEQNQLLYHLPNAAPVGGGEPILSADGSVLGAVGVSGVSPELDRACALDGFTAAIASEKWAAHDRRYALR